MQTRGCVLLKNCSYHWHPTWNCG